MARGRSWRLASTCNLSYKCNSDVLRILVYAWMTNENRQTPHSTNDSHMPYFLELMMMIQQETVREWLEFPSVCAADAHSEIPETTLDDPDTDMHEIP